MSDGDDWAVVVVNYGAHRLIERHLGEMPCGVRVVVVDNLHSPAERATVTELADRRGWELVALPDNRGFGAAVNAGVARARAIGCTGYLLVNPDARVGGEVITALRQQVQAEPRTAVSPRIADSAGRTVFQGVELLLDRGRMRRAGGPVGADSSRPVQFWLTGACLAVHDSVFTAAGGFDEDYFLYWEDVDLSFRMSAVGAQLRVRDDLTAVHDEGGTQSPGQGRAKSELYYYYNCRNRLLFAARNLDRSGLLRWIWHTPASSWEILLRGGRRQLLRSPRPAWAALRGTMAGLRLALRALRGRADHESPVRAYS